MIRDSEKFKHEDEKLRERVNSKNKLESYIFSVKQSINEAQTTNISVNEKKIVKEACDKELKWLDANQQADKEEYDFRYNELSRKCSPIMSKLHQSNRNGSARNGPTVEEVD